MAFRQTDPGDPASYPENIASLEKDDVAQKVEQAKRIKALHQKWFGLLVASKNRPDLLEEALGLAILGKAEAYLSPIASRMTSRIFSKTAREKSCIPFALGLILSKLQWPSARPSLEKALENRTAYWAFLAHAEKADPALISFLKQPDYFCRYISAEHSDLQMLVLEKALGTSSPLSLYAADGNTRKTIQALIASSQPLQCALGLWVYAHDSTIALQDISAKLAHPDPWVRRTAVISVIQRTRKQEKSLTPLLGLAGDPSADVRFAVVAGLLPDRIRQTESVLEEIDQFKYETIRIVPERQYFMYDRRISTRPFRSIRNKPSWFERFRESTGQRRFHDDQLADLTALLHAVYGDFTLLSSRLRPSETTLTPIQLLAISLCRDDRYVSMLEKMVMADPDRAELERILNATRHWTGDGVRDLRRMINRLFRKTG